MKKRDVMFLCQFFYPECNSSSELPYDTAQFFASQGLTVGVMCGYPKEYTKQTDIPSREEKDGIHIRRIRYLQLSRNNKFGRLINYFSFTLSALFHIFKIVKYRSVIVYSNPPILPIIPIMANIFFKTRFIFVAYDIYPEVAYASNSLTRNGFIDRAMRSINHQLYLRASKVVALTEEMSQFVLENRPEIDETRLAVIPNWAHEGTKNATDDAYKRFGYNKDQFIVSYFGNLGVCQDIETMLAAIRVLKDDMRIQFLIAGHGTKMQQLKDATNGYSNVKVLDFLVGDDFECALAISSCCIVSLENGLMGTCAPSKYYSYLQSGSTVLAVAEENSYLIDEVYSENIGYGFRVGAGSDLAKVILQLLDDREKCCSMGEKARNLYEKKYSKSIAMKKYKDILSEVLSQH